MTAVEPVTGPIAVDVPAAATRDAPSAPVRTRLPHVPAADVVRVL
ncbi:MAG: hypothetical protein QOI16_2430, partial [Pseudonocardiales bacterium]|nr:hypothetical protein [Pseudonocardiales bacterium]